jgi:NAD(P)-dependent dehydrogenase (short-subunit alcohol dehydrogenase family)
MSKTVLITGANRGIGLALTELYLQQNYQVIAVCRQAGDDLRNTTATVIDNIDVSQADDIASLAQQLTGTTIDILINNAGIFRNDTLHEMNFADLEEQFAVNAIAPLRVTKALLGNLTPGSKVGLITSRMGSIDDNDSGGYYGYRMSKAALNAAGKSLANDLQGQGIAVAILHPGMVATRMIGFNGDVSPAQAAAGLAARIDELTQKNSGTFWHANGDVLPW